ncbi:MAG: U32 family peptidase, partial [Lachnospiraceae bacterium]|nr:U32 family peptidase [Lachnospiraceae bacterium]
MKKCELLSPAGSYEVFKACIAAGADAVYMGLPKFSARAYAENAETHSYVEAIRYAHLHGKKLYCTINTLMKEQELYGELYDIVKPLYEAGLDGVIVQDIGEMRFLHTHFPDLPLHASTQATVVGPDAVPFLRSLGIKRI